MIGWLAGWLVCFIVVFKTVKFIWWAKQTDHKVNTERIRKSTWKGFKLLSIEWAGIFQ